MTCATTLMVYAIKEKRMTLMVCAIKEKKRLTTLLETV